MGMPHGDTELIRDIVKSIEDGDYRIPRFQRDFVWEIKKSAALIDSIFRGYPIGSIILWKTKNKLNCVGKKDLGGILIKGRETGRYTSYIIDGQQRLTSLFMAVKGLTTGKGQDFSQICVSLVASGDDQLVYDALPKDADPEDYISLKDLYDGAVDGKHHKEKMHYFGILQRYSISVIDLDDDEIGLEQVVEIFERLNLGGKKLNMFSIVAARSYFPPTEEEEGFDLTKKLDTLNKKLKETNYGTIADATFLQVIAACLIGKTQKTEILKRLKDKQVRDNYDAIEKAIFEAIEHLKGKGYGAVVSGLLPYERLLVPFAYFHYHQKRKQITKFQEKYLVDYFWRCVLTKRFNNAADANTEVDLARIQAILKGKQPTQERIVLSPKSIFENGRFILSSGYVLGMLCLMAQKTPQSLSLGTRIEITNAAISKSAQRQYHHFFPKQSEIIQDNREYREVVNNVVNIVFMDSRTNNQIKNMNPSKYISRFAKNNTRFSAVLKTHYIAQKGFGIETDDFFQFLNARSNALFSQLNGYIIKNKSDSITNELPF